MPRWSWLGAAWLLGCAGAASAKDGQPCAKDMICASAPTTIGGINRANFTDMVEWWSTMMGTLDTFMTANPPAAAHATVPTPPVAKPQT